VSLIFDILGFFKFLVELGPKKLKLQAAADFMGQGALTDEERQKIDEKVKQCHEAKENRKRKAEEDINDRYTKIAKMSLPELSDDNLSEILDRFPNKMLLIASRVNKQFSRVSRKMLFGRLINTNAAKIKATKEKQISFISQIRNLKIIGKKYSLYHAYRDNVKDNKTESSEIQEFVENGKPILSKMTKLEKLTIIGEGDFAINALLSLTQLKSLEFKKMSLSQDSAGLTLLETLPKLEHFGMISWDTVTGHTLTTLSNLATRLKSLTFNIRVANLGKKIMKFHFYLMLMF
jgi:hypothetical protein